MDAWGLQGPGVACRNNDGVLSGAVSVVEVYFSLLGISGKLAAPPAQGQVQVDGRESDQLRHPVSGNPMADPSKLVDSASRRQN